MKREEQIRQAALAYSFDTDGGHSGDLNAGRDDFIEGGQSGQTNTRCLCRKKS